MVADSSPAKLKPAVIARIHLIKAKSTHNLNVAQREHKATFDRCIRRQPAIQNGDLVYVDRPPAELGEKADEDPSRK